MIARDKITPVQKYSWKFQVETRCNYICNFLSLGSAEEALEELDNKERNGAREIEQEIDPNPISYDDPYDLKRESEKDLRRDSFKPEDTFGEG